MPTPIDSLQSQGHSSSQTARVYPQVGDIWQFQHYPTPVSVRGKGGWNHDPVARSRVIAADAHTRDIMDKVSASQAKTRRQVNDQLHKTTPVEKDRLERAQMTYLTRLAAFGEGLDFSNLNWEPLAALAAGAIFVYFLMK